MENIRIEQVSDVSLDFPYLEIFLNDTLFLEISISDKRELEFVFYPSEIERALNMEEWDHINTTAKEFLETALKNFDYLKSLNFNS